MTREDMLARLIAQAGHEGGELITLRAIVEEASELGANRVLDRLGLGDPSALETAWRDEVSQSWERERERIGYSSEPTWRGPHQAST